MGDPQGIMAGDSIGDPRGHSSGTRQIHSRSQREISGGVGCSTGMRKREIHGALVGDEADSQWIPEGDLGGGRAEALGKDKRAGDSRGGTRWEIPATWMDLAKVLSGDEGVRDRGVALDWRSRRRRRI